ncbi:MAG TPA: DUF1501 domain-containing protein [Planctomycetota bacterium]|nr:DUF1501 domain-containing protein [Planctomycetota bacterium]
MSYACGGHDHRLSRRTMLGLMGGLALGRLAPAAPRSRARQVLLIWLDGGLSQLESWDPKPQSPYGGPFRAIPTSADGIQVCELWPHTAKRMHRLALVRSMKTQDDSHSMGVPRMLRGDPVSRGVPYPYLGSAMAKFLPREASNDLPPYVWIKPRSGGFIWQHAGFLGPQFGALALGDGKPPATVHRPEEIGDARDAERQALRKAANERFKAERLGSEVDAYESSYDVACRLMARKKVFTEAPDRKDAERYGTHPLGRHLLQARALLEAGVSFVKVTSYHWDTHCDNFRMHQDMVPQVDRPFAALIDDLHDRGLLENVVVVLMSEFGRTPKINARWGRDHWPSAWSIALAGAGLKKGVAVGKTSPDGSWVDESPYDVGHLFHTVFRAAGLDPDKLHYVNNGQPLPVLREDMGAIKEVLA